MRSFLVLSLLFAFVCAQDNKYKFCASSSIQGDNCNAVEKGDSRIKCEGVMDSAHCAIQLKRGEADFGIFTAEELLLANQFYPQDIVPLFQLRHTDKQQEKFQFQAVAVVPSDLSHVGPGQDFSSLRDGGLCHPGFNKSQWWNDYILKYFEKKVYNRNCQENLTAIENEIEDLSSFFGKACRPGKWVLDDTYDQLLKGKFMELCSLCDNPIACTYNDRSNYGHTGALECLKSGRGKVAFVALSYVRNFFKGNESFSFLCPDGSVEPLSTDNPCAWVQQPWDVIVARKERTEISNTLKDILTSPSMLHVGESWEDSLKKILLGNDKVAIPLKDTSSTNYLAEGRKETDLSVVKTCGNPIKWCTIGDLENEKCNWIAKEAIALGIEPKIECKQTDSVFQCFRDIASSKADIITIDSNYGYLARKVYNLSTVMYCETAVDRNSVVVAVVKEPAQTNYAVNSFYNIKGKTACFPEYGGIAWLSFINIIRTNAIVDPQSCNYAHLVSDLLSGACAPGVKDNDHSNVTTRVFSTDSNNLCSACQSKRNDTSCVASKSNPYFGDGGALECLSDDAGEVAFVEARNLLNDGRIDENRYRLLCKNSSLALGTGFQFDEYCALSVTIDSEIVGRKNESQIESLNSRLALLKLEEWLGYRVDIHRPIRIYDHFNGTANLLFKDSTSGLLSPGEENKYVSAYKDLFNHIEACTAGVSISLASGSLVFVFTMLSFFYPRI